MAAINELISKKASYLKRLLKIDFILLAILGFAFIIRLYGIENPFVDFSSWRQIDTLSIAKFFAVKDFNILHPQLFYDGPGPNYSQLELQITTFFIALLFKFVGMRELYARIIPLLFFTGSALFLYMFVKRHTDRTAALLTTLVYSILPMGVYYGRAVQPESTMLFFGIASLYTFSVWLDKKTIPAYLLTVTVGIFSVLAKLPNIFLFLPIAVMASSAFGKKVIKNKFVYAYFFMVVAITVTYFLYLGWFVSIAGSHYDYHNYIKPASGSGSFVSNIASKHILPQIFKASTSPESKLFINRYLINLVTTPLGFALMLIGFLLPVTGNKKHLDSLVPFYAWALAALLYTLTIVAIVKIDYYLVPVLPVAAFFIAMTLRVFTVKMTTWPVAMLLIGLIGYQSFLAVAPLYNLDLESYKAGIEFRKELRVGEPVILGTYNPAILFYSDHNGWRSTNLSLDELLFLKSKGAGYYIPLNSAKDKRLTEFLNSSYVLQNTGSGCVYYDLKAQK